MIAKRNHLLASTVLASALAVSAPALAQTPPATPFPTSPPSQALPATGPTTPAAQEPEVTEVDEIVVTGSRIRRSPVNAPTPLIQVQREDLLSTGQTTVIDYLATIPALSNSVVPSDTTGSNLGDGGLSLPNLRSLGSNRTLTLVDGRRHVGSSGGSLSVDVDTIPRLLIENVEIVTGGASSVYGADAVSGVLNFVLRKDFEGLEIDANYGMINQDGQANRRISALAGANLLDDRLNVYVHGEYEEVDEVTSNDIDWIDDAPFRAGIDADPTNNTFDGDQDFDLFRNVRRIDIPRWGATTLANSQPGSALNDPDVPYEDCFALDDDGNENFTYSANCFAPNPGRTFYYDGATARLADFGERIGNTGLFRPYNIGGDGENIADFSTGSRVPRSESKRFQAGATFAITQDIEAYAEAKYVTEDTFDAGQPTFFDVDLVNSYGADEANPIYAVNNFDLRWDDNAFLPELVRNAIAGNVIDRYAPPTDGAPSVLVGQESLQLARHSLFGPIRTQDNTRELQRYVLGLRGSMDRLAFIDDFSWDVGYTYGEVEVENRERGVDGQRFALAADAVFDTGGVVNGTPGQIVCRVQLLAAQGAADGALFDPVRGGDLRDTEYGQRSIDECAPLNIFGKGNQTAEALAYVDATIGVTERNEQEQAIATVSGNLFDLWGAGPIGVALGAEYRREATSATGRDRDTDGRLLFLNTGPDFIEAEYDSTEYFAELSVPLFSDSWLGEYAELSGSYRFAEYSTVGDVDVYGVNLVYRPIQDIAFKTSYNTSVRVPDLGENFSPLSQTFANGFEDPCATLAIAAVADTETQQNRIANCTALAADQGLAFDFAGATASNLDDFNPNYTSGIAGSLGGNPGLDPEESTSFTFSTVLRPRFIPNFSLVLDYYEIEIEQVIAAVSASTAAANCVNGASLNADACGTIFRNDPDPTRAFYVGAPNGDAIGGFIERSFNYAKLETRGLDFTANYSIDSQEMFGRDFGRFDYRLAGSWLIDQQQFLNEADPGDFDELASSVFYPRVRLTSSLTYAPNDTWSVNWTADWQTAQDIVNRRDLINNADSRLVSELDTQNFTRHDFTVRWNVRDDLILRGGVVNAFDAEQPAYLGTTLYSNFDPYGTRFFIGLNYRPF